MIINSSHLYYIRHVLCIAYRSKIHTGMGVHFGCAENCSADIKNAVLSAVGQFQRRCCIRIPAKAKIPYTQYAVCEWECSNKNRKAFKCMVVLPYGWLRMLIHWEAKWTIQWTDRCECIFVAYRIPHTTYCIFGILALEQIIPWGLAQLFRVQGRWPWGQGYESWSLL